MPPPRWTSGGKNKDVDDNAEEEKDPWESYDIDTKVYLRGLREYLGVRKQNRNGRVTRRALTSDEPRGFVEISPVILRRKRKRDFMSSTGIVY
ncbi:hypothetical protein ACH5RR_003609 [Cinchona calisaya]|uniref:Uncharacterized protein n=1 Tax=Cinchona calisaya TaxID=153742 RepID=A0ABD3AVA6_9GENT